MLVRRVTLSLAAALLLGGPCFSSALRVKANAPGPAHDGGTWDTAFLTVQSAVDAAHSGDEVWVASGTYLGTVRIPSTTSVSLYGGFTGVEENRWERSLPPSATILNGNQKGTVVAILAPNVTVDGFTIRGGMGTKYSYIYEDPATGQGSGVYCAADGVVITHNVITANDAYGGSYDTIPPWLDEHVGDGGGIACLGSRAMIAYNSIVANTTRGRGRYGYGYQSSSASGAGVAIYGDDVTLFGNTIARNAIPAGATMRASGAGKLDVIVSYSSAGSGAGVVSSGDRAVIRGNTITDNVLHIVSYVYPSPPFPQHPSGSASGGGLYVIGPGSVVSDNLIARNTSYGNSRGTGGGLLIAAGLTVTNNTIADNSAVDGGGLYGAASVANNIIAFNTAPSVLTGAATSHNCFFGEAITPGATDIAADPLFVDRVNGDYHLQAGSPCIDAGDDSVVQAGDTDLDGRPRILGAHVDIGAYEMANPAKVADARRALAIAAGLVAPETGEPEGLDLTGDGRITVLDAVKLLRKGSGLDPLP